MTLLVDKVDPATQGWPSAQQIRLVADPSNGGLLFRKNNGTFEPSKSLKTICVEMSAPELSRAVFGNTIALPPTGYKYLFADTTLDGNPLVTVDSDGIFTTQDALSFVTENAEEETVTISVPLQLGANTDGEGSVTWGDEAVGLVWFAATNSLIMRVSSYGGNAGTYKIQAPEITIGTAVQEIALFGATPVSQPAALTTKNTSAFSSGGTEAMTDADKTILDNMRTRINELETKLTALGALHA